MLWYTRDMKTSNIFIRNIEADDLLENFFISAVSSLFVIRFFLFITGYPELGGNGLHIAHMLWGGFFMLAAIVFQLTFLNRSILKISASLGGIGFGAFIDELGKFVTSDNNYFFQPTIALIYIIFVFLFLLFRMIPQYKAFSKKEYLINALDMTKEAVINDLDTEEERLALEYVKKSDLEDPIAKWLYDLLSHIDAIHPKNPSLFYTFRRKIRIMYFEITKSLFFTRIAICLLLVQASISIVLVSYSLTEHLTLSLDKWGVLVTASVAAVTILHGLLFLRRSRLYAFKIFKIALLILILLTQFFLFYSFQFYALSTLFFNITMLFVVDYAIKQEEERIRSKS